MTLAAAAGPRPRQPMDPIHAVQVLREGGCGGILPPARSLEHDALLDRAAREWAAGHTLGDATESSGYQSEKVTGLRVSGSDTAMMQQLRRSSCLTVTNRDMRDVGVYRRGTDTWLILGRRYVVPSSQEAPRLAARALALVNERGRSPDAAATAHSPPRRR